jgi:multiple sugar transport system permease protein
MKTLPGIKVSEDAKDYLAKGAGLMEELRDSIISPNFTGLDNYKYFMKDSRFWEATGYTFNFTVISVFFELILGLTIALIINRNFKGRGLVRASVLIPWAIPTVVGALMWKFLYDGQFGIISHLLTKIGIIPNAGVLLTTDFGAKFSVIFADVWKTTPYMALLLLAGLQTIDSTLYEAADVDGATKIQQFFRITLPLLKPTILVALLFRTLDAFRVFDLVYVLTGGGNSTETITSYAYKNMFAQMDFGKGSTLSVIIFICIATISIGYIKILGAEVMSAEK